MKLKLWENKIPFFTEGMETPNEMTTYLIDTEKPLPAVVVLPGGGYGMRSPLEAEPVARFFNSRGFHSMVVEYRVAPNRHPAPLADAQRAIKLVRYHAEEWRIDPNKIIILGFSAGGHLAASTAVLVDICPAQDEVGQMNARPNGAVLCYPVISLEESFGHVGSGENLLGEEYNQRKSELSLQNRVNENTPPCFLWHTADDEAVPVQNSLAFAQELRKHKVPYELHIFPHGAHGLDLALGTSDVSKWAGLCADWIINNFK